MVKIDGNANRSKKLKRIYVFVIGILLSVSSANGGMFDNLLDGIGGTFTKKEIPKPTISVSIDKNATSEAIMTKLLSLLQKQPIVLFEDTNCSKKPLSSKKAKVTKELVLQCLTPEMLSMKSDGNIYIQLPENTKFYQEDEDIGLAALRIERVLHRYAKPMVSEGYTHFYEVDYRNAKSDRVLKITNPYNAAINPDKIKSEFIKYGYKIVDPQVSDVNVSIGLRIFSGLKESAIFHHGYNPDEIWIDKDDQLVRQKIVGNETVGGSIISGAGQGYASASTSASGGAATLAMMGAGAVVWAIEKMSSVSDEERQSLIIKERCGIGYSITLSGKNNTLTVPISAYFDARYPYGISLFVKDSVNLSKTIAASVLYIGRDKMPIPLFQF